MYIHVQKHTTKKETLHSHSCTLPLMRYGFLALDQLREGVTIHPHLHKLGTLPGGEGREGVVMSVAELVVRGCGSRDV